MPPKGSVGLANKSHNQNAKGVLSVNPAAIQQSPAPPSKSTVRLKLHVRRLPPALTKDEFLDALGEEWQPMAGRIDWFQYRPGKVKGTGNISEQSRAYLHLTAEAHIRPFEAKFLSLTFHDAKGSYKDANMKHLQPSLEFAPNQRVPAAKQRVDGRQGTIDQDPEFIAFLEAETQPVTKPASLEAAAAEKAHEKVSSTPLLDDLREKKANKAKAASSKPTKSGRGDHKEDKAPDKPTAQRGGDGESANKSSKAAAKSAQPSKEAVKSANKQAAKGSNTTTSQPASANAKSQQQSPASPAPARKQRDRGTTNAIKSLLQRDLGLAPAGKRGAKSAAATAAAATAAAPTEAPSTAPAPLPALEPTPPPAKQEPTTKSAKSARSRKANSAEKANAHSSAQDNANAKPAPPAPSSILKKAPAVQPAPKAGKAKANAQTGAAQTSASSSPAQPPASSKPAKAAPQPAAGAVKAYLKHANASQGITEQLILAALSPFGDIVKVDIDKRKGTALAEFKNHEGLKAAMAKRSVVVAQGAVEILEYRERPGTGGGRGATPTAARGGGSVRGKGRSGRGGAAAAAAASAGSNTNASSTPASPAPAPASSATTADAT